MVFRSTPADDFNLKATLTSGQVFGFAEEADCFSGHLAGSPIRLKQEGRLLRFQTNSRADVTKKVRDYFDLDRSLEPVYQILNAETPLQKALQVFRGLRLIKQDSWEALACFIISSNNNVKRIQGIWRNLTSRLGQANSFPKASDIARTHERILREMGLGYRAPYLVKTAQFIATNPNSLAFIREATYEEAKEILLRFPGIGEKVADCVLLYGFQKLEAFPVDVWILRIMRKLYFKNRSVSEKRILQFGQKRWKEHAGYVQQYLFHSVRMGIL